MYEPENQSLIGSLIQKTWGENQGHLTPHVFQKKNLSLLFHFIIITISSTFHFTSSVFISSIHLTAFHPLIHPFIPFHFTNKVFFRQLKYFMQLEDFITVPAAIWQFCSRLAFLQPSAPAQETQSVWRKIHRSKSSNSRRKIKQW